MSPVKPHLSLGMPKTSFRKIPEAKVSITFAAESRKTRENAWFSQRFVKSEEKRAKANLKNKGFAAQPKKRKKRVKTRGFRQVFEERARGNDEKAGVEARPRGIKNA